MNKEDAFWNVTFKVAIRPKLQSNHFIVLKGVTRFTLRAISAPSAAAARKYYIKAIEYNSRWKALSHIKTERVG